MPVLPVLLGWVLLSVPVSLVVGAAIRRAGDAAASWSDDDDQHLAQWMSRNDCLDR